MYTALDDDTAAEYISVEDEILLKYGVLDAAANEDELLMLDDNSAKDEILLKYGVLETIAENDTLSELEYRVLDAALDEDTLLKLDNTPVEEVGGFLDEELSAIELEKLKFSDVLAIARLLETNEEELAVSILDDAMFIR